MRKTRSSSSHKIDSNVEEKGTDKKSNYKHLSLLTAIFYLITYLLLFKYYHQQIIININVTMFIYCRK